MVIQMVLHKFDDNVAAYGYMMTGTQGNSIHTKSLGKEENIGATVINANAKVGNAFGLGAFYAKLQDGNAWLNGVKTPVEEQDLYGFNTSYNSNKVFVAGEWLKSDDYSNSTAWVAGIGYGSYNMSKAGTWDVKVQYFDAEKNAALVNPAWDVAYDLTNTHDGFTGGWQLLVMQFKIM